ncbi:TetR/AcrR family transcriptional regulator [Streptomyces zingiberis]|uniref:TetR/AcrR family transcriptional regulator n=1 Tax=Streptomyces zingiberis TaxID=2053010 RepID=A0ABX1BRZ9_9ACTN|nr:TetR/AcrR family transcriptional regulator [Streptomyces zingiberis]NJP99827.1 TetR/AcrR family transcriptional regulator [Streptomyces zingiberis]
MRTPATAPTRKEEPRLRADALRNRERIVAAARELFVEHGAEIPLDEVARRAGVGNATLYRHFSDRDDLIRRVTLHVTERIITAAETALAEEPDGFEALCRFVHAAVAERIGALCPLLAGAGRNHAESNGAKDGQNDTRNDTQNDARNDGSDENTVARERLGRAVEALMERARASGRLRDDVETGDLLVAVTQLTRPLPSTGCAEFDRFVHRHLRLFLDGLQAPARSELPGSAATWEDLRQRT